MQQLIKDHCGSLKLGTRISENYPKIEAGTHEEFLEKLLKLEEVLHELSGRR